MKLSNDLLNVFVYGSLKKGFSNHDDYCHGVRSIEPASIRGILFEHPSGFPVVQADRDEILAVGTSDPATDMAAQRAFTSRVQIAASRPRSTASPFGPWRLVRGELMRFDDPASRLPALDDLEAFHPDELTLYRRVLLPVQPDRGPLVPAWVYVLGACAEELTLLHSSSWTPGLDL